MSTTLYRKYRPQIFAEVVGQKHVKITLQNEIESNKLAHAFLFSGPRGVGKTTIARILAKALNCKNRNGSEPCDKCSTCEETKNGRSLDLIEIDAASNRGINEIRELREQARVTPAKEKYKVFIIDEVHMLTTEAFNALLKTLEEPPPHDIFILATTEIHKIPETIISRCQRFDFKKVTIPDTVRHLTEMAKKEDVKIDQKVLENIARHSEGYLRDAISLLGQVLSLGDKNISEEDSTLVLPRSNSKEILRFIESLLNNQTAEALSIINNYIEEGGDLEFFTKEVVDFLRRILLSVVTNNWQELLWDIDDDALKDLQLKLQNVSPDKLRIMLEILLDALSEIRRAEIIQLPLELAVIRITEQNTDKNNDKPQPFAKGGPSSPRLELGTRAGGKSDEPMAQDKPNTPSIKSQPETIISDEGSKNDVSINKAIINLKSIKHKWLEVAEALKEHNHSLSSFIKGSCPKDVTGDRLTICFKYSFHMEKVNESRNKILIQSVLEKIFNKKLLINCDVDEKLEIENSQKFIGQKDENMVEMVLDTLGGEVVG